MEQIYYTQCPVGYGLGTSNGFQIKRLDPAYPMLGDFRHLTLRAFLPGARSLAPETVRYRIAEDGVAEVACLTARTHEYHTERGLWGRPGGQFAHGLRLNANEMSRLRHWPAGLIGQSFWRRDDPGPTLGAPPAPIELPPPVASEFETAARLAAGRDVAFCARLLTALASAARDGRTLVVIDRPEQLGDLIALLTLAFPEVLRAALTFSTYHDRPEELTGYRLQGAVPDPRADRGKLSTQGFVADMSAGTIDPPVVATRWAELLASWLVEAAPVDRDAWESTDRRARVIQGALSLGSFWTDEVLDLLFELPAALASQPIKPARDDDWRRLAAVLEWPGSLPWSADWVAARGPAWWSDAASDPTDSKAARAALIGQLRLDACWRRPTAARDWGKVVADWLRFGVSNARLAFLKSTLVVVPAQVQAEFLKVVLDHVDATLRRESARFLRNEPNLDPLVFLPLEVRPLAESGSEARLVTLLEHASAAPSCLTAVLASFVETASAQPETLPILQVALTRFLEDADESRLRSVLHWVLRRGPSAIDWFGPYLERAAAAPDGLERWRQLGGLVEPALQPEFAALVVGVACGDTVPTAFMPWAVETFLLPNEPNTRPRDPAWPGVYLDRLGSDFTLFRRLFARPARELGVRDWLIAAATSGELSTTQTARLERCGGFARALKTGDVRVVAATEWPNVLPEERGKIVSQILEHVAITSEAQQRKLLAACVSAWPDGLRPGARGLSGIATALAKTLWLGSFERLNAVFDARKLLDFEPDGFYAEVLAASARRDRKAGPDWAFREQILRDERAWRALAADVRYDLSERNSAESLAAFDVWDRHLPRGVYSARFFEVWLNSCEAPALAATVEARAGDLRTLPSLRWWRHSDYEGGVDDLRDAFARLSPLRPLDENALTSVRSWMSGAGGLSEFGRQRWACLDALSAFHRSGLDAEACWQVVEGWTRGLSLEVLTMDERYVFLAWVIRRTELAESQIARLASWLTRQHLNDPDRARQWAEELGRFLDVEPELISRRQRFVSDLRAEWKSAARDARGRV